MPIVAQFHAITGLDTVSYLLNVSKRVLFERTSSGVTPFNIIVELGSSNITIESVNNAVTKFLQKYLYLAKKVERIVGTIMRQYDGIQTRVISPDPNSLTQHIKRANIQAYYWVHCMSQFIQKCNSCLSGWIREKETGTLIVLWYDSFNQLPQSMSKRRSPNAHKRAQTQKTAVIDYDRLKKLNAAVAKINMQL